MAKHKKKDAPQGTLEAKSTERPVEAESAGQPVEAEPAAPPAAAPPSAASPPASDDDDPMVDFRALVGASMPPPAPVGEARSAPEDDDDDGTLDLAAMASSMAPSPTVAVVEPVAAAAKAVAKSSDVASAEIKPEAAPTRVAAIPAPAEKPRATGILMGVAALAAVVVVAFALFRNGGSTATAPTGGEPTTIGPAPGAQVSAPPVAVVAAVGAVAPGPSQPAAPSSAEAVTPSAVAPAAVVPAAVAPAAAVPVAAASAVAHPRVVTHAAPGAAPPPSSGGAVTHAPPVAPVAQPAVAVAQPPSAGTHTGRTAASAGGTQATTSGATGTSGEMNSFLDRALGGSPTAGGTRTNPAGGTTVGHPAAGGGTATQAPATAAGPVPNEPSRGDIARGMGALLPGVRQCAGDQVGLATASVALKADGTVVSASVAGVPFGGTPQGACMEGVIRRARFAPFQATTFRFTYPLAIR